MTDTDTPTATKGDRVVVTLIADGVFPATVAAETRHSGATILTAYAPDAPHPDGAWTDIYRNDDNDLPTGTWYFWVEAGQWEPASVEVVPVAEATALTRGDKITVTLSPHGQDATYVGGGTYPATYAGGDALNVLAAFAPDAPMPDGSWPDSWRNTQIGAAEGTRYFWVDRSQVTPTSVEVVPEQDPPDVDPSPTHASEVAALMSQVATLATRLESAEQGFEQVIRHIGRALKAEAESRDYCHEFEESIDEMANGLPSGLDEVLREEAMRIRTRDYSVYWSASGVVTVTGESMADAEERFNNSPRDFVDIYDVSYEVDSVEDDGG